MEHTDICWKLLNLSMFVAHTVNTSFFMSENDLLIDPVSKEYDLVYILWLV